VKKSEGKISSSYRKARIGMWGKEKAHVQFFPHLFYFLYIPWFRAAGRRLIHLLILHAERQTVDLVQWD
jgi:hypothetical protein